MKIKLLALDVDGTITESDNSLDLEAAFLIKNLPKIGIKPVFVTGRSLWEAYSLTSYLGLERLGAAENGGVIFSKSPSNVILMGDLSAPTRAFDMLSGHLNLTIRNTMPRFTEITLERPIDIDLANEILKKNKLDVRAYDSGYAVHLVNNYIDKGRALDRIREILHLDVNEIASIGDSVIDIPMFRASSLSFAVSNSSDDVKNTATYVTKANAGKGLIEAVSKLLSLK